MEVSGQQGMRDAELDMARQNRRMHPGKVRRIFNSLVMFQSSYTLATPRRSIDSEAQRYSPLCE
jgi:hypothetical protein